MENIIGISKKMTPKYKKGVITNGKFFILYKKTDNTTDSTV